MSVTKGRLKKILMLQHHGWIIILEPSFPSDNYILTRKNASHGFRPAYCGSFESALMLLFEQMLIENIDRDSGGRCVDDLRRVIVETKREFKSLLSDDVMTLCREKMGLKDHNKMVLKQ
jgi:hypothetical protein